MHTHTCHTFTHCTHTHTHTHTHRMRSHINHVICVHVQNVQNVHVQNHWYCIIMWSAALNEGNCLFEDGIFTNDYCNWLSLQLRSLPFAISPLFKFREMVWMIGRHCAMVGKCFLPPPPPPPPPTLLSSIAVHSFSFPTKVVSQHSWQ